MIPGYEFGTAVDIVRKTDKKDFANLMPRPGWQE